MVPSKATTLYISDSKQHWGTLDTFFSSHVITTPYRFFEWEGKVYEVVKPSCSCQGKQTYKSTEYVYSTIV